MRTEREAPVPAELAAITFGPLDKYVAGNDNTPQGGQYIGLTRHLGDTPGENRRCDGWQAEEVKMWLGEVASPPTRTGDFMQTFSGRAFWPLDPQPDEVFIEDIAHSLSLQCRYAGHCVKFYSVAEHSVLIARWLLENHGPQVALWGLLHDAPEAYVVDVPRPLKPFLANYKGIEAGVMAAISSRYGLAADMPDAVHEADGRIICDELVNLLPMVWHGKHDDPLGVTLEYWSPEEAEVEFLAAFDALTGIVGEGRMVA